MLKFYSNHVRSRLLTSLTLTLTPEAIATGDMKHALKISLGLTIVRNIWGKMSTQLNIIYNMDQLFKGILRQNYTSLTFIPLILFYFIIAALDHN